MSPVRESALFLLARLPRIGLENVPPHQPHSPASSTIFPTCFFDSNKRPGGGTPPSLFAKGLRRA